MHSEYAGIKISNISEITHLTSRLRKNIAKKCFQQKKNTDGAIILNIKTN